ncbi:hypothetical protein CGRA01v4_08629 [Colletotrichum graminicola]|uniref:Prp 4 CRoW domain-containing protein n=1 Tax=Colletotrichum graminicola (strain M1.001 / M2 / FGSC 10212) TaxID=645133 RepID=E3QJA9_COLGM|nr:uncharacterized protein GLRG_06091 [Colletotrichum graminicola M1.001]EFQ30947.1 hypothetical protein GLRG_06091 [Colletotrichum graminicola M1.001]WDK17346.1 hypothetical protein CGRA01v4_08629 [Colletotrichum graminicola]
MQIRSLASLAYVAFAAQAFAQQTKVFKRSVTFGRDLGFMRRADSGYQPADELCNKGGNTCAEACGGGYQQCKSTDQAVHCYNPAAGETCCSTTSGNSCLSSFYCTHDPKADTICCPNGMNLGDCAAKHGVAGALTSDVPVPTTTSVPSTSPSSTVPPTTTSAPPTTTSISSVVVTTTSTSSNTSTIVSTSEVPASTEAPTSFSPSAGTSTAFLALNGTTLATGSTRSSARSTLFPSAAATTTAASAQSAGNSNGPAGMAVILGAAFVAALL